MKIISIIGQKGGTGKTTLAKILAVSFDRAGYATAAVDLDAQASLSLWGDLRAEDAPKIIALPYARLPQSLPAIEDAGTEILIIDTGGHAEQAATAAAKVADLVILPVQPTPSDLVTIPTTLDILTLAKNPPAFTVLVRVKAQGSRHDEAADYLKKRGLQVCPHTIGERVTYQDAERTGQTAQEIDPTSKAAQECELVHTFTLEHLHTKEAKRA